MPPVPSIRGERVVRALEKAGFAVLAEAQALGDLLSLVQHQRRVLAVRLGANLGHDLDALARSLQRLVEAKAVSI